MINLENDKVITVYSFDQNNVYSGCFEYHWTKGTGLAANSTLESPLIPQAGFVCVWNNQAWERHEDHRDKVVYSTLDRSESKVDYIGAIKEGFTLLKPISEFDSWNGAAWIDLRTDQEKLEYARSQYPSLTRYQFLRCLLENGFKASDIEAQIQTIEDEFSRELALLGFKEATNFVRTDESILAMQSVLSLTDERVDQMWEYALTL
ncbi:hypothetical protein [Acinetobacter johnsonii]|uniref:hypothetical protein n=1 Tax=Acinetobacter johnsonii TaxID=40214 RepID=UPI002936035E|nr:hypothetical protein [Acinetobacter johnsonii]MDV2489137.1 hypothetical protein [Acinetobacter johnsonii]